MTQDKLNIIDKYRPSHVTYEDFICEKYKECPFCCSKFTTTCEEVAEEYPSWAMVSKLASLTYNLYITSSCEKCNNFTHILLYKKPNAQPNNTIEIKSLKISSLYNYVYNNYKLSIIDLSNKKIVTLFESGKLLIDNMDYEPKLHFDDFQKTINSVKIYSLVQ